MAAESFFTWGAGGAKLTPEQIALARQLLARKNAQGADTSPVQHWTQGAARVADALGDVFQEKRLNSQEKDLTDYNSGLISNLLTGGGSPSAVSPIPSPGAAAEVSATSPAVDISGDQKTFIDSLLPAAIEEGKRTGVDPRIIVAQAAQETGWGKSAPGNNYFGIKSHGQDGGNSLMTTEYVNGAPVQVKDSFRAYQNPADSVRGYGDFILQNPRYSALRSAQGLDAQLEALQASGYATDPNYSRSVGAIARGIQLPNEVASLDPSAGAPAAPPQNASDAINAYAPQQGAPALPPPTTVAAAPPVASVPAVAPAPVQAPTPNIQVAQDSGMSGQTLANAMKVLSDPRANANTKAIAEIMVRQAQARQQAILEQQLKQSDPGYQADLDLKKLQADQLRSPRISPTDQANIDLNREKFSLDKENSALTPDIKEYNFAKQNGYTGSFAQYQLDLKKSAANNTTINNGEGNKFYNTLDENNAKIFSGLSDAGIQGRSKLGQIDQLEGLLNSAGTGAMAVIKQRAGDLGINTEGLSDIQAASALLSKMIPEQRAPGSGPVSDADLAGFRNSLPRLINQPGGNTQIINTMRGLTQYQIEMGSIADRVANREITPEQGRAQIANLPNPLANFKAPPKEEAKPNPDTPRPRAVNPQTGAVIEYDGKNWVPVQ